MRGLPHALFFPERDWSGAWPRLNARRLAVPKEARFGPPPPEEARFGPQLTIKNDKILTEMGLYGSVWVHIEGIRSHRVYKGFYIGV